VQALNAQTYPGCEPELRCALDHCAPKQALPLLREALAVSDDLSTPAVARYLLEREPPLPDLVARAARGHLGIEPKDRGEHVADLAAPWLLVLARCGVPEDLPEVRRFLSRSEQRTAAAAAALEIIERSRR
jgi:hypothetical protein